MSLPSSFFSFSDLGPGRADQRYIKRALKDGGGGDGEPAPVPLPCSLGGQTDFATATWLIKMKAGWRVAGIAE